MKTCFECEDEATEEHHVVPKSLGGTKTVPLCSKCHAKVHGLDKTRRADSSSELIKRGHDRLRPWDLFATYDALVMRGIESASELVEIFSTELNTKINVGQAKTLIRRIEEVDEIYLKEFFYKHIDHDLAYVWDEDVAENKTKITFEILMNQINAGIIKDESDFTEEKAKELIKNVNLRLNAGYENKY
jgi:hypothetical protein